MNVAKENFAELYEIILVKRGNKYGKLNIIAGKATPAPPITPCLGQRAINIPDFCKKFNGKSADIEEKKLPLKTSFSVNKDKSLNFCIRGPSVTDLIKSHFNLTKGASNVGHEYVGEMKKSDLEKITKEVLKYDYMNTSKIASVEKNVISIAKSIGMKVVI